MVKNCSGNILFIRFKKERPRGQGFLRLLPVTISVIYLFKVFQLLEKVTPESSMHNHWSNSPSKYQRIKNELLNVSVNI